MTDDEKEKLEIFTGLAMQGLLSSTKRTYSNIEMIVPKMSVQIAQATLAELDKCIAQTTEKVGADWIGMLGKNAGKNLPPDHFGKDDPNLNAMDEPKRIDWATFPDRRNTMTPSMKDTGHRRRKEDFGGAVPPGVV
ncbi:MAG: hypothetical protein GY941_20975 [Planctomycetes bacterium]|nr:hypothetical protein [Planctomycetota bacterium]